MQTTLPTMYDPANVPQDLLSTERPRQSPMTKKWRGGIRVGVMPSATSVQEPVNLGSQGSLNGLPSMRTVEPREEMVSPGNPMTRFTRSPSVVVVSAGG